MGCLDTVIFWSSFQLLGRIYVLCTSFPFSLPQHTESTMPLKADVGDIKCSLTFVTGSVVRCLSEEDCRRPCRNTTRGGPLELNASHWAIATENEETQLPWLLNVPFITFCLVVIFIHWFFSLKSYLATLFFFFSNQTIFIPVKIQHFGFLWTICSLMQTCTNIVCCFFEMEEYCLGEMCFQFSFLRHSYRMKISSLSLSQEMKELRSIILMGCVICSCTDSSTHPAKVNSKVFTEWATEEMHLYGSDPGWDYVVFKVWWLPKSPGSG